MLWPPELVLCPPELVLCPPELVLCPPLELAPPELDEELEAELAEEELEALELDEPPLDVEVVAGDTHSTIRPGSNVKQVEITRPVLNTGAAEANGNLAVATNAAVREAITADAVHSSQADAYPILAHTSRVEGSVVLQAVIGANGLIQDVHVVSGPAMTEWGRRAVVRGPDGRKVELVQG